MERYRVLVIEDNPADAMLIRKALRRASECDITVLEDGDKAFRYLEQIDAVPDLIVLDLNLPGRDGGEILALIRRTAELRELPVAVVSSSPMDVLKREALHADCYITKPADLQEFLAIGKDLLGCVRSRRMTASAGGESDAG
jgi:CheY-like chemotaxis protein